MANIDLDDLKRQAMFVPCKDRAALARWIRVYLDIDLLDSIVCDDDVRHEPTNSSPLDFLWEVYSAALDGKDPKRQNFLFYAARNSGKTLCCSIIELLCLFHLKRDVCHLAAILSQSEKNASYMARYFTKPIIRDYLTSKNKREFEVTFYERIGASPITQKQFNDLTEANKNNCKRNSHSMKILVASYSGTNSSHVPFLCLDGDTKILVKNTMDSGIDSNRNRIARTARGIFKRLLGVQHGGKPASLDKHIDQIVLEPKEDIQMLSVNLDTGCYEFKSVVRAQCTVSKRLKFIFENGKSVTSSPNHPFYLTDKGFTQAKDIRVGDKFVWISQGNSTVHARKYIGKYTKYLPETEPLSVINDVEDQFDQVVLGSLLGDMGIYKRGTSNPYLAENHCMAQSKYLDWKKEFLARKLRLTYRKTYSGYTGAEMYGFYSGNSPILMRYWNVRETLVGIDRLGALGLAIWYMDDGCKGNGLSISTEGFTLEQNLELIKMLKSNFDIDTIVRPVHKNNKIYYHIYGDVNAKRKLSSICKPHIHPSMAYKFDCTGNVSKCTVCGDEFWHIDAPSYGTKVCSKSMCILIQSNTMQPLALIKIEKLPESRVYDFTLDGNHNFFANGILTHNCLDELDLIPSAPFEEAKMIPSVAEGTGALPITIMTSSRKFSHGLVAKELDKAEESGTIVRHWNAIDGTEPCPPSRHLPEYPKIDIYYSEDTLKSISQDDYELLIDDERQKWIKGEGYVGCLSQCKLYSVCQGRLATKQTSKSKMLQPINHIQTVFKKTNVEVAKSQMMSWKPESTGLIYPRLSRDHCITAAQMIAKITGEDYDPQDEPRSKADLLQVMQAHSLEYHTGLDHGFTHLMASVTGGLYGKTLFIFHVLGIAGLELGEKITLLEKEIKQFNPIIYADPSYPSDNTSIKRAGFQVKQFVKDVELGINTVRAKLTPSMGQDPEMFFLAGDDGCEMLYEQLSRYHWKLDGAGKPTDQPDKEDDDLADSLRYLCQNLFGKDAIKHPSASNGPQDPVPYVSKDPNQGWMANKINELTGGAPDQGVVKIKKGGFKFSI